MKVLSLFIYFWVFSVRAQQAVLFYDGENFAGQSYALAEDCAQWREKGFVQVNAIRVPTRCTVILFREPGFSGDAVVLREDLKKVREFLPWSTGIGSVQVHWDTDQLRPPPPPAGAVETAPANQAADSPAVLPPPVKVSPVAADSAVAATTAVAEPYGAMDGRQIGVILYDDPDFSGVSDIFYDDDKNLTNRPVGSRGIKSARIPEGYRVILYEKKRFGGRFLTLTADNPDLRDHEIGSSRVASIRVSWADPTIPEQKRPKVVLFAEEEYDGTSSSFYTDDPDFDDDEIGDNRAASIRIPKGCQVTLYDGKNFHGRAIVLQASKADLDFTEIGKYRVSSLRIRWETQRRR